jgi:hypothetical protein
LITRARLTVTVLHVQDAVLLEDGAEHGLDDNAGGGVSNEGALLVELLGEEVDTEVPVLASGSRGGDANHLARAVLEHEEVANADVVAGDRDRVGHDRDVALTTGSTGNTARGLAGLGALYLGVAVAAAGVCMWENLVSKLVETLAEGTIMTCGPFG